ncbi:zinc finger protein 704 isoform X2 [Lampris incognitus]|uniref:zinc finger protein 704 isoform X2 n=1 Tax=Lampris incognitus TaxID=2546036 RepID=UPI0024B4A351|nr:zinc finger protein 704 isoform X2 [Lampris incognitus]
MNSKRTLDKPCVGIRVGGAATHADFRCHADHSGLRDTNVASAESGLMPAACTNGPAAVLYTLVVDGGSVTRGTDEKGFLKGNGLSSAGATLHDIEQSGCGGLEDQGDTTFTGVLKRASPTHCSTLNGQHPGGLMYLDIRNLGKRMELANGFHAAQRQNVPPAEKQSLQSSHIPVPRHRKPSGHADKEVMAATVLTSLSTSPLVLHPASTPTAAVPEPASRGWKDALSASYSSSTSGNWSWDASDQSVPSTPSPPLSNDANKSFLLSSQGDDICEDVTESTHFLFEDPIPRKRKNSMKVMFKCLWKNCEKVLSTSSGIQRHIRTIHLGRNCDSDYSDGEEDFYYSEIEVNMDSLSEGLSSLTPTSPTTAGPPPVFPSALADIPHSEHISTNGSQCHTPTLLSQSAPSNLCHIRTDHAYQGPVAHVRTLSIGEKRQPASAHSTVNKNHASAAPAPKLTPGTRKPRGEAKKCRKVYGMEKRDMWCTACRWKKACQRFTD